MEGVRTALARTGGVITSAGLILAGTFSVLTTFPLRDIYQLGFAVALGVLMDTFIVRALFVPRPSRIGTSQVPVPVQVAESEPATKVR